ncbi:MAG: hypothetical protein WC481_07530 [Candidatus Omnitrophota bacterium]
MKLLLVLLALSLTSSSLAIPRAASGARAREAVSWRTWAAAGAAETGVSVELIEAVVVHESGGDLRHAPIPCADGSFDYGPGLNSRWLGYHAWRFNGGRPIDPTAPESALIVARILAWHLDSMGDEDMALTAYRRGQHGAREFGIDREYVARVRGL